MQPDPQQIRVSDADRQNVVDVLGAATRDGRLSIDEYSDRVASAYAATRHGELAGLVGDLPVVRVAAGAAPADERISAILANESRKGHWVVPEHLVVRSVLGDCHLELQNAELTSDVTTIDAGAVLGTVTIFVPDGVAVRMFGRAVLGSKTSTVRRQASPGAPVLHVRCDVWLGSVTVRPPKWFTQFTSG